MTNAEDGTSVHHNDNTPVRKNNGGSAAEGSTERSTAHPISAVGNPYFADALSANRVTWTQGAYSPPIACVVRNNVGSATGGWTEQSTAHLVSAAGNPYDADTLSGTHKTWAQGGQHAYVEPQHNNAYARPIAYVHPNSAYSHTQGLPSTNLTQFHPPPPPSIIHAQGSADCMSSRSDITDMSLSSASRAGHQQVNHTSCGMGMVTPHGAIQAFNNHLSAPRSLSTPAQQTPGHLDSASMHNTLMGMSSPSSKEGGSNEETLLTFPPNWLPEERGKINTEWAKLWWRLAHSLSKKLPETDAKNEELEEFCNLGRSIWDHTRNQLNDRLLEHLRMKCLQLDIAAATDDEDANTSIANIHGAVMRCWDRDTMSRDDFLRKVLAIVLVPLTKDKYQWLIRVKTDVQARWKF